MQESTFVAFLRGINVGGNAKVAMADLKKTFEELGFTKVQTLLNSGNVVFTTAQDSAQFTSLIEQALEKEFKFKISVIIRPMAKIKALVSSNPFAQTKITPQVRLYVSFVADPAKEICSVIDLSSTYTTDLMKDLEKKYGKQVTTRNWNTVSKIATLDR